MCVSFCVEPFFLHLDIAYLLPLPVIFPFCASLENYVITLLSLSSPVAFTFLILKCFTQPLWVFISFEHLHSEIVSQFHFFYLPRHFFLIFFMKSHILTIFKHLWAFFTPEMHINTYHWLR